MPRHNPLPSATRARYVDSVYWFRRPPYLRWVAAVALIVAAAWVDLRPRPTVPAPFAAVDLAAGATLDDTMIEWRSVPAGLLPVFENPQGIILRPVVRGEPLVPSVISSERVAVPDGWWSMETRLPAGALPGQSVQLILLGASPDQAPQSVQGIVIVPPPSIQDPLAIEPPLGLIAIPGEHAVLTAAAIADGRVSAMLGAKSG